MVGKTLRQELETYMSRDGERLEDAVHIDQVVIDNLETRSFTLACADFEEGAVWTSKGLYSVGSSYSPETFSWDIREHLMSPLGTRVSAEERAKMLKKVFGAG